MCLTRPEQKAVSPGSEGFAVVQPQNFDVVEQQTGTLYRWQHLRQRWNMAARARESAAAITEIDLLQSVSRGLISGASLTARASR